MQCHGPDLAFVVRRCERTWIRNPATRIDAAEPANPLAGDSNKRPAHEYLRVEWEQAKDRHGNPGAIPFRLRIPGRVRQIRRIERNPGEVPVHTADLSENARDIHAGCIRRQGVDRAIGLRIPGRVHGSIHIQSRQVMSWQVRGESEFPANDDFPVRLACHREHGPPHLDLRCDGDIHGSASGVQGRHSHRCDIIDESKVSSDKHLVAARSQGIHIDQLIGIRIQADVVYARWAPQNWDLPHRVRDIRR